MACTCARDFAINEPHRPHHDTCEIWKDPTPAPADTYMQRVCDSASVPLGIWALCRFALVLERQELDRVIKTMLDIAEKTIRDAHDQGVTIGRQLGRDAAIFELAGASGRIASS